MKILKKIKIDMWINAIMTLIIGILFIARPQGAMEVTAIVAGAVIFANGLIDLIYYMNIWSELYIRGVLFEGILKCILGIFIITHSGITSILFSYIFSIYIIISGIICLETAVYMQKAFGFNAGIYVVLSCVVVIAGIIMMFFSPDTVKSAALMAGVIFVIGMLFVWLSRFMDAGILPKLPVSRLLICRLHLFSMSILYRGVLLSKSSLRSIPIPIRAITITWLFIGIMVMGRRPTP